MSKFVFKLQSFLNIKQKIEEQKNLEYGKAVANLNKEKDILINIFEEKENYMKHIKNSVNSKLSINEIRKLNEYLTFLDLKAEEQEKRIKEQEKLVHKTRIELVEAMKDRKMIETLKDKEKEIYNKEQSIKEQKIIDEIVSYKYNLNL